MNTFKYIFRSLKFYKKQHLALLLGTILSTAVLTGALIVGDSVKYSLNRLVEKRLGNIVFVMQTNDRFVTDSLSGKLATELETEVAGMLNLKGLAINSDTDIRLNSVEILGVDSTFWQLGNAKMPSLTENEVFLSENIASRLQLKVGNEVLLRVEQVDIIPVHAPFAQEKPASVAFRLTVKGILDDNFMGRFSLKSDQKAPYNVWVSKLLLCKKMGLENQINTLLIADQTHRLTETKVQEVFENVWTPDDANLTMDSIPNTHYLELTSNRVFIDNTISMSLMANKKPEGVLTYLINSIKFENKETPYSFVSGVSKGICQTNLNDDEIVINDWCANDLGLNLGDSVSLEYYAIGPFRKLEVRSHTFLVKSIEPNQGALFVQNLTPNFPGLSDAVSCSEWETSVPINFDRIRDKDEVYWNDYRGTPKAVISIETAQKLWGNQFGGYTALRFPNGKQAHQFVTNEWFHSIHAKELGLQFTNVKNAGKSAAGNGVDFGELFLSLSFFVIAAGLLLLVLIYSLNCIARKTEIGVLTSLGIPPAKIKLLFIGESAITIFLGGLLGMGMGIIYNNLVLRGLNTLWQDAVRTHALEIYINPPTLALGAIVGILLSLTAIYVVINKQLRLQVVQTLKNSGNSVTRSLRTQIIAYSTLVMGLVLVGILVFSLGVINANLFLTASILVLISLVTFIGLFLKRQSANTYLNSFGVLKFALKSMGRQYNRSLMAILLLALGTFSVIITGANRLTFYGISEQRQSGTGGFQFWVENSLPIIHDLNSQTGKAQFNFADDAIADSINFYQMLALDGDDASCLNLNQVQHPRILGIHAQGFKSLNPFSFAKLREGVDPSSPWSELQKTYGENVIPAYADQTVITWGLMKKVGDTLLYKNEMGVDLKLVIAGGLNSSIFQGNILIDDSHFRKHFPSVAGSNVMLLESKAKNDSSVAEFLEFYFKDFGIEYTPAAQRLAEFNSVTNTYLNVFMILGGLGVAIGTLGFGIIVLRNKLERKQELALLKALGIKNHDIFNIIFLEHFMLLAAGLGVGFLSAIVGMLPSFISPAFSIPGMFVVVLLLVILLSGMVWIWLAARVSNDSQLISSLRKE